MVGKSLRCRRASRSKMALRVGSARARNTGLALAGFTPKTITAWLWFVKRDDAAAAARTGQAAAANPQNELDRCQDYLYGITIYSNNGG